ncbi:TRAP transporter fused permease subunit [Natrinema versiforme]|uniref:TRAP transporter fused permease subunit n=1 Tax=Natrinema versiforme TaxID=88724 RepID=A0A4P8WM20_9EURY|nr:TRAP transporter fused permease subunit [Natrinema versiforme]QCS44540.1 TRAP transporter fused permease subunit [Natrinema versiforme]
MIGKTRDIDLNLSDWRDYYIWLIGVPWAIFHLYAGLRYVNILTLTYVHVMAATSVAFALNPTSIPRLSERINSIIDIVLVLSPVIIMGYLLMIQERVMTRIPQAHEVTTLDLFFGTLTVILLLEATRRIIGVALAAIAGTFIAYGFLGPLLPPIFAHSGLDYTGIIDILFLTEQSFFGTPAKMSARYVFLFVLFGSILLQSGADDNFLDLAKSIGGDLKGGAAKIAVAASALMATINGSAVANTVSTGSITIPMMNRSGYDAESAGATESLASTGGQLMPPVMGAAAFIMADISGIPYFEIVIYAIIPSILFYVGVYSSVHFEATRQNIGTVDTEDIPPLATSIRRSLHLSIPILGLLFVMYTTMNVEYAASVTVLLTFVTVAFHETTRMSFVDYLGAFKRAAEMVVSAAIPCAVAGIIIGIVYYTGIAARITSIILSLTAGMLVPTLILVAVICLVLGMGMPTTAAYVTVAVLAVPTLIELGMPTISAHLFGLYFSVISMVTPPIAIAAFAASSISGGSSWKTGIQAFKMGLAIYIVPFLFLLHPSLLGIGTSIEIGQWFAIATVVVVVISAAGVGYLFTKLTLIERVVLLVGALVTVFASSFYWIGLLLIFLGLLSQVKIGADIVASWRTS